jgi:hypothetical protein
VTETSVPGSAGAGAPAGGQEGTAATETANGTLRPGGEAAAPTPREAAPPAAAGPWRLVAASTGIAPLISVGSAAQYAPVGLFSQATLDFRFRVGPGALGVGLLTGFTWLAANGIVENAQISLVPVAADFVYTISEASFPIFTVRLSGGGAMMSVSAPALDQPLAKIIPFALAGLVLDFPFTSYLGLAIEASYVSFFEESLWIMGFTPQVSLYVRL